MTPTLNIADLSLAILWLFFAVRGYMRGLVKEAGSLAAIVTAFYLAGAYHKQLAPNLTEYISGNYAGTAAYLLIFTVTLLGVWFVALAISGIVKITMTQWADRFFGGGFGLVKGVILTAVLLFLLRLAAPDPDFLKGSLLVPVLDKMSTKLVNYIPPDINEKLRKFSKKELPDPINAALEKKAAAAAAAAAAAIGDKKPAEPEKKLAEPEKKAEPAKKPETKPEAKPAEPPKKTEPAKPAAPAKKPDAKPESSLKPASPALKVEMRSAAAAPAGKTEAAKAPDRAPAPAKAADKTAPPAKPRPAATEKPLQTAATDKPS
ncbi:MAG: putative membrane protein, required for colicin V production [Solidesulfovibrio magneticus str. Maddingley MBC34]|uniref:Putative membrane protein, required for colicin V production n=1 Tax=Solidesulfovibrio magneticus str. Maddingley MBC34 TaxID=1206767 RepID=K6FPK3_9BACT|nr:MAG: putative membrane protein, required for colicin V production [Solidesulfovibrio magneticus str. Maddingley MBC34]